MTGLNDTDIRLNSEWQLTQATDGDAPLCSGLECLYQNIVLEALAQPGDVFYDAEFGWGLYGSRFLVFLCHSDKVAKPFFVVYSFVSILGATVDLGLLWSIADTFNGLMSIPNLIALLLLSGTVVKLTKEFFASEG